MKNISQSSSQEHKSAICQINTQVSLAVVNLWFFLTRPRYDKMA